MSIRLKGYFLLRLFSKSLKSDNTMGYSEGYFGYIYKAGKYIKITRLQGEGIV